INQLLRNLIQEHMELQLMIALTFCQVLQFLQLVPLVLVKLMRSLAYVQLVR
ncbi:hypothetical protein MKW94_009841, partial [Papaver nudicaule]|nr:hypothetical protein [Papaver nudicaule]